MRLDHLRALIGLLTAALGGCTASPGIVDEAGDGPDDVFLGGKLDGVTSTPATSPSRRRRT